VEWQGTQSVDIIVCHNVEENKLNCNMTIDSCVRNNCTGDEFRRLGNKAVVTTPKILPQHLAGSTDGKWLDFELELSNTDGMCYHQTNLLGFIMKAKLCTL
jgi:hypothetical protein